MVNSLTQVFESARAVEPAAGTVGVAGLAGAVEVVGEAADVAGRPPPEGELAKVVCLEEEAVLGEPEVPWAIGVPGAGDFASLTSPKSVDSKAAMSCRSESQLP